MVNERGRYYVPNGRAEQFLGMLKEIEYGDGRIRIFILRAGNSFGKTALAANIIRYLCDRAPNPYFDAVPYLRDFPRKNKGRLCTTANAAKKTYDEEFPKWFPRGRFEASKNGRDFKGTYRFPETESEFDIFTFDQDPNAGESITLDWGVIDEPMMKKHWSAFKARFRFGGLIIMILTPLEGAAWYHDELETQERMADDVRVMEASSEDACITHGIRGVIPHAALADMWRDYDEMELPARRDGKYLQLGGVIYQTYRTGYSSDGKIVGHEPEKLEGYHADCFRKKLYTLYNVVDPHDRKPFAVGWYAVFPNEDVVTVAEWPDASMRPFHKMLNCSWSVADYAKMILATEAALGKPADVRLIDPNFGPAPKATSKSSVMQEFASGFEVNGKVKGRLYYRLPPDSIAEGHIAVKKLLGNIALDIRPKFYVMKHCTNHSFAFTHYGYKENRDESKGLSEKPELHHKDFADLPRYGALYGFKYLAKDDAPRDLHVPREHASGYRGL